MTKKKLDKIPLISKKLREENRSNDYFELMLANLTLEELICLKLETYYRSVGLILSGFPIWRSTSHIIRNSIIKFAVSVCSTHDELSKLLGISKFESFKLIKKYKVLEEFLKKETK